MTKFPVLLNFCVLSSTLSLSHLPIYNAPIDCMRGTYNGSSSGEVINGFQSRSPHYFKSRRSLNLGSFGVRTLSQAGKQTCLALTIDSLAISVFCVNETWIMDSNSVIQLTAPNVSSRHFLSTSGDESTRDTNQRGVGIVLTDESKAAPLDWIPVR